MPYTVTTQEFGETSENIDLKLQEGHTYYVSVKAFNGAGLSTLVYSWATIVDASPPVVGQVYDGRKEDATHVRKDQDYQTDPDHIWAFWDEFEDPHSGVVSYSWSVGSCPGCEDVFVSHYVGFSKDAAASHLELHPGLTYYVTVTACNAADMCSSASSDGIIVDVTPPVAGIVSDGVEPEDIDYQASRKFVAAKWWGFTDPQSGILHYSWWAGTTKGGSEIFSRTVLHRNEMAYRVTLPGNSLLPVGKKIYITVRATNHAGLNNQATSNGFMIDSTAPVFKKAPRMDDSIGVITDGTRIVRNFITVKWEVTETDSYIEETFVSFTTDQMQRIPSVSTVRIEGHAVSKYYSFTKLKLQDGSHYYATVKSCNAAKLCALSKSKGYLVDTSPPTIGTFAINTTSAANLPRQPNGAPPIMAWIRSSLALAWVGFADLHSGISKYHISVGTTFEAHDLGRKQFPHRSLPNNVKKVQSVFETSEGLLQLGRIKMSKTLSANMEIYVQIRAENSAGLMSYPLNKKFRLIDGGTLYLERRCDQADTCLGHCTCAKGNGMCPTQLSCLKLPNSTFPKLKVVDVGRMVSGSLSGEPKDANYTAANSVLAAKWYVADNDQNVPIRYDWSIGLADKREPTGVFRGEELIWHDAGQYDMAVHTFTNPDRRFDSDVKYAFFLRAWRDLTSYATYVTDGITIDDTPPQLGRKLAAEVKDCNTTRGVNIDVDFYSRTDMYCLSWKGRFHEPQGAMQAFIVGMGSYPGGSDVIGLEAKPPSHTSFVKNGLTLVGGQRYYGTVVAINKAMLFSVQFSDGFIADTVAPVSGAVFDGFGLHDLEYQNQSSAIGAHWSGFVDFDSYIDHYFWCVGVDPSDSKECTVIGWTNVGLKTRVHKPVALAQQVNKKLYNKVYAVDGAGWGSAVAVSDGFIIDKTPPKAVSKLQFGPNQLKNPSFEADIQQSRNDGVPLHWKPGPGAASIVYQDIRIAKEGAQFLVLFGSMSQELDELEVGSKYRVVIYASHVYPSDSPTLTQEAKIDLPDGSEYVFKFGERQSRPDIQNNELATFWHEFVFYFVAPKRVGSIKISTVGQYDGAVFDALSVKKVLPGDRSPSDGHMLKNFTSPIHVHAAFSRDWNSIQLAWEFQDLESPIVDYTWAIGNSRGKSNLLGFKSVGKSTAAQTSDLNLRQASAIYATIIATNAAGMKTALLSDAIYLDVTKPVFEYVYDGDKAEDIDYQEGYVVKAHWKCQDTESGIQRCMYALGSRKGATNIKGLTNVAQGQSSISVKLTPPLISSTIYVTVRCWNDAGISDVASSDGVTIVSEPPSSSAANVILFTPSETVYPLRGSQSRDDMVLIKSNGFVSPYGVSTFKVQVSASSLWHIGYHEVKRFGIGEVYVTAFNMKMKQEPHTARVIAMNVIGRESSAAGFSFKVDKTSPVYNTSANGRLNISKDQSQMYVSWDHVFTSDAANLIYEVSLGTVLGGADILQWKETNKAEMVVHSLPNELEHLYVTVTAISANGLSTTKSFLIQYKQSLEVNEE